MRRRRSDHSEAAVVIDRSATPSMREIWRSSGLHAPGRRVRSPLPRPPGPVVQRLSSSPARRRLSVRIRPGPPRRRSPTGRGARLRPGRLWVRIPPSVPTREHLDVAQRQRTGLGCRGLEVRVLPSRPTRCEVVQLAAHRALNPGVRVRSLASQPPPAMPLQRGRPAAQAGVPSWIRRSRVRTPPCSRARSSAGRASECVLRRLWFPGRSDLPVSCDRWASFSG